METLLLFAANALLFSGIKSFRKKPTYRLSNRKHNLRNYFILGLGVDGRIANALWHHDPWLAGPCDSSREKMEDFVLEYYYANCRIYSGFTLSKHALFRHGSRIIRVELGIHGTPFDGITYFFDDGISRMCLTWLRTGCFVLETDYLPGMTSKSNYMRTEFDNFDAFRRILLDTTHAFVTLTKVRNPHEVVESPLEITSEDADIPTGFEIMTFLEIMIGFFAIIMALRY